MIDNKHTIEPKWVDTHKIYSDRTSNIRVYGMKSLHTVKISESEDKSLCTFTVETTNKHLNEICGMIGKLSFENPENKQIRVFVNGHLHSETYGNFVEFSVPSSGLSSGQIMQEVAIGRQNTTTQVHFPEFCDGKVHNKYLNMSRVDRLQIDGLTDDSVILIDCYIILTNKSFGMSTPDWVSYALSF